ncbi:MAG: protein-disulfide reductase DsbD family protein [Planctomycetota bacterium]|jgi:thiol:disulfide interchange protein DsbD
MFRQYALILVGLLAMHAPVRAGEPAWAGSPFAVNAHAGYAAARPGEEFPVALVFDIADKHKIYEESVKIDAAPGSKTKLLRIERPRALEKHDGATGEVRKVYLGRTVFRLAVEAPGPTVERPGEVRVALSVSFQGCSETVCFLPETRPLELRLPVRPEGRPPELVNRELFTPLPATPLPATKGEPPAPADDFTRRSPLVAILLAFAFGLLLSFTPCVYPLVPVTVAVIGARTGAGGWRKGLLLSLVYVLGLSVTYAALGVIAAKGGSSVGAASQHWAVVTVMAVVFVALAVSLFGVYDLEIPSSWQSKLRMRRAGGPVGIFLMGMLSGLVATPCVAAPLASVLVFIATTGSIVLGAAMLFAMAWGMGALLILAGTFSGLSSKLPKAGGWMVGVKTALGIVLLFAALYFLRPVLPVWAFTAWLAVPLFVLGVWRGVWKRTAPDTPRGRLALRAAGLAAFVLGTYLGVGALIREGMPAPLMSALYPDEVVPSPSKITFRTDYEAALREAEASRRPVMIDFVLPNCSGCRQLEENVFSRDDVAAEAKRFVTTRVDLAAAPVPVEELKARYRIFGAPSVVWIDTSARIRHDLTVADGGVAPEEFLRRMRAVE